MKYILFGAGPYMKKKIDEEKVVFFDYIVDNDKNKIGTFYLGKEIRPPEALYAEKREDVFVVIAGFGQLYSIEHELKENGFKEGVNYIWIERLKNLYPNHLLWEMPNSEKWEMHEINWRKQFVDFEPHERAILVSNLIDWEGVFSVLDLGAGSEPMRPLIPEGVSYYPVDYKKLTEYTNVFDFNKKEFPKEKADVVVMIGVAGYVNTTSWLIDKAASAVINEGGQFIASFNYYGSNYSVLDFLKKYSDRFILVDYAFRDEEYGIFKFRKR